MKIKKILNNNTVIAIDESGEEVIVMNPGLGFHKKKGILFLKQKYKRYLSFKVMRLVDSINSC